MGLRAWLAKSKHGESTPVTDIKAARALYIGPDSQRIDLEMKVDGERLVLELGVMQAQALIQQLSTAYLAINPPLKRTHEGLN